LSRKGGKANSAFIDPEGGKKRGRYGSSFVPVEPAIKGSEGMGAEAWGVSGASRKGHEMGTRKQLKLLSQDHEGQGGKGMGGVVEDE